MQFKKWQDPKKTKEFYIDLREDSDGDLGLVAVDKEGNRICSLLYFTRDGEICLSSQVDKNLGFDLDEQGRIKAVKGVPHPFASMMQSIT